MALTKTTRRYCPNDGTPFRTTANLNSLMRSISHYNDDMSWPKEIEDVIVPVTIQMRLYKGGASRQRPDGMIYGPVVRIGTEDSPEIEMFGMHHAAGLTNDYKLDDDPINRWIYKPLDGCHGPGEECSVYRCDLCNNNLYRDDLSRRHDRSACLVDGSLVCRDCEVTGLVHDQEVEDRLARCRTLADFFGTQCRKQLDRMIERLSGGFSFGSPSQTRLFQDGEWSFFWRTIVHTASGDKEGMHGGLIQHSPHPTLNDDGSFTFTIWDHGLKRERQATAEEVGNIHWGIHT